MKPPSEQAGKVSVASAQGKRDHQEDRAVHEWISCPSLQNGNGWLLAAFDGHGGAETADKASKALPSLFETHFLAQGGNVVKTLREVFASLNQMVEDKKSGSTASVVFIPQEAQNIILAVLGDSPVAVQDATGVIHIGPEHNVRTNLQERTAALARGGVFQCGYLEDEDRPGAGLQMARSLGDAELSRVLNREPEIMAIPLGGKGTLLIGTDGLLFPGKDTNISQVKRLLQLIRQGGDAQTLVKDALERRTGDNVTAIVWRRD